MKFKKIILLIVTAIFFGCSKNSDQSDAVKRFSDLVVTTKSPILLNNNTLITTGGNLSISFDSSFNFEIGVCYNFTGNPTISDGISNSAQNISTSYDCNISNAFSGQTIFVKAFVRNNQTSELKYGNELSFQIPFPVTTDIVKNISATGFSVNATVSSGLLTNDERGICYSTGQNPTIANEKIPNPTSGLGSYTITIDGLGLPSPNYFVNDSTNYYLRSYVKISGNYYYGNQVSFKTAGYTGGSGGYVFFDKGEVTNGWRYLEAATSKLIYNNDVNYFFSWNYCNSTTFLSGISNLIGTGLENSILIRNNCNLTSNAAAIASTQTLNGKNDWFLPSIDELKQLYKLKALSIISATDTYVISSSQTSNNTNFGLNFFNGNQVTYNKNFSGRVWQTRRF